MILSRRQYAVRTGVHDLRIFLRRRNPPRLTTTNVVPVARSDAAFSRATRDTHGRVVLLRAVDVVWKIVVERDAIEESGGLVLLAPTPPAVEGDVRAPIVTLDHANVSFNGGRS